MCLCVCVCVCERERKVVVHDVNLERAGSV